MTKDWKSRLYDSYISSGHVKAPKPEDIKPSPYHSYLIKNYLPKNKNAAILDCACGHGSFLYRLKNEGYSDLSGIDISQEQVDSAHQLGLDQVSCGTMASFLSESSKDYDFIILLDIIEHLENQEIFDLLDLIHQKLRPGGKILIHCPNGAGLFGQRIRYGDFTHLTAFNDTSLQQILNVCHFKNIQCFEDKPLVYNFNSLVRRCGWSFMSLFVKLFLFCETGVVKHIISQNLLAIAEKDAH